MRILVLGINYPPEKIGIAVYTGDLAQAFVRAGHQLRVVTAKPYYPDWHVPDRYKGSWWKREQEHGVRLLRCPLYVPRKPSGIRRLLHHVSFMLSSFTPMAWQGLTWRPDVVLCIAPSLAAAPVGWMAARLGGSVAWLHVQDFEVEAAVVTGLLPEDSRIVRLAQAIEQRIMRAFDHVSSISIEMCRKLVQLGVSQSRVHEIRNWANLAEILPQPDGTSSFRQTWGINTPHVALYSGNIANKQGIEIVVAAAKRLAHRDDLTFVICGDGPNKPVLEQEAAGTPNIVIANLQPKERLSDLLALATIHLLPQKGDAADLVLPSKLTNILASGRPVIATAAIDTGLAREVEGCGLVTPPEDEVAFANAIVQLIDCEPLRQRLGNAARARAEYAWDKDHIVAAFADDLATAVNSRRAHVKETVR
jgi:colanic acid biosynthesis glycosyl transferase WcaI